MSRKNVPKPLQKFLATSANDIAIPGYSDILENSDDTLRQKGGIKGVKIYQELIRDGRVRSTLDKRKGKVTKRE